MMIDDVNVRTQLMHLRIRTATCGQCWLSTRITLIVLVMPR